ncbi:hypothetical protein H4217_005584 [Coemansia sp. RSA 1939]|nr:hypothetical protein H4217_005584 [Coemansia sp. RSA 1939]KAJ2603216.1 hypothetical protein EV177_006719 [Coemansia sp. RSA 1804]
MAARRTGSNPQAVFFTQTHQRNAPPPGSSLLESTSASDNLATSAENRNTNSDLLQDHQQQSNGNAEPSSPSRIACLVKFGLFFFFARWVLRKFEIDRSLRKEPGAPHIAMFWMWLAFLSSLPFVLVYLYASIWRRRVLGEPLDLQNWQADCSTLVHVATVGLLAACGFAFAGLYPGFGLLSIVIIGVCVACTAAMVDAVDAFF